MRTEDQQVALEQMSRRILERDLADERERASRLTDRLLRYECPNCQGPTEPSPGVPCRVVCACTGACLDGWRCTLCGHRWLTTAAGS